MSFRAARAARSAARQGVRFNSSSAQQTNPQVQKAVENAQKALNDASAAVRRVSGPVGDRIGQAFGSYRQPIVYNFKVFTSLLRQVYQAERLAFPFELSTWANAYSQLISRAVSASWWKQTLKTGAWAGVAVGAVEVYGIFSIGEIIGRRHIVGYGLKE